VAIASPQPSSEKIPSRRIACDEVRKANRKPRNAITSAPQIDNRRALRSLEAFRPVSLLIVDSRASLL
jgi:hypothetical protein